MTREMAIAATSPVRTGARRPWRSDQRPNTGLMAASMPAEIRNAALIPSAPQPRLVESERRYDGNDSE